MSFESIAFHQLPVPQPGRIAGPESGNEVPSFFGDLNLDQIVESITLGREEYELNPLYYSPVHDVEEITYRHEVFRDLENDTVLTEIRAFAQGLRTVRGQLSQLEKLGYRFQKQWWFLNAVRTYCLAVGRVEAGLSASEVRSRGLEGFREFLSHYVVSERFTSLRREAEDLLNELSSIRYSMLIKDGSVTVRRYDSEPDFGAEVDRTFAKFRQSEAKSYLVKFSEWAEMNHVEAAVMHRVARLNPATFHRLEEFVENASDFMDPTVERFDREIQFYVAYLELARSLEKTGLRFCYPTITNDDTEICSIDGFDLALANKLTQEGRQVVTNDFNLRGRERIFVVSGPNQGGKTTFARTFGQLHYLAALGCPVPGSEARLFLFDNLFTHFEREEDITTLRGKLHEDLVRMREIVDRVTANSIVILNEVFNSTTLTDEVFLTERILAELIDRGCLGVCVTFIDELSRMSESTVSMVSTVVAENPAQRTFKVVRKEADGLAYALAIARKHGVTYESLTERLSS